MLAASWWAPYATLTMTVGYELTRLSAVAARLSDSEVYKPMMGFGRQRLDQIRRMTTTFDVVTKGCSSDAWWFLKNPERAILPFSQVFQACKLQVMRIAGRWLYAAYQSATCG